MNRVVHVKGPSPPLFTALGLGLLSTTACCLGLVAVLVGHIVAQRPAARGVMVVHLSQSGDLRLWNQPISPQDVPRALERLRTRHTSGTKTVVRLVPEREVPWGIVHQMLQRLRPTQARDPWILQLQLP
jgi:hypothetical protein